MNQNSTSMQKAKLSPKDGAYAESNKLTSVAERRAAWRFWVKANTECLEQCEFDLGTLNTYFDDFAFADYLGNLRDTVNAMRQKEYDRQQLVRNPGLPGSQGKTRQLKQSFAKKGARR